MLPLTPQAAYAGDPVVRSARAELVRVGVNHEIAKANGFEVRVDSKGVEYSVPLGSPPGLEGTVEGPCGWSWFDWVDIDWFGNRASIFSGFQVRPGWSGVVYIEAWTASVIDGAGGSNVNLRPGLGWIKEAVIWTARRHRFGSSVGGSVYGEISAGIVVLFNGTICFALRPNDSIFL